MSNLAIIYLCVAFDADADYKTLTVFFFDAGVISEVYYLMIPRMIRNFECDV